MIKIVTRNLEILAALFLSLSLYEAILYDTTQAPWKGTRNLSVARYN